ncbi:lipase family protein [Salana multivorans]|uniref:lipase family protein n=1 Tax=Salana multivorans TaxID=120377 RepID=UPI0031ED398E
MADCGPRGRRAAGRAARPRPRDAAAHVGEPAAARARGRPDRRRRDRGAARERRRGRRARHRWVRRLLAALLVVAGLVVLFLPGLGLRLTVLLVGLLLLAQGVREVITGALSRSLGARDRVATLLSGVSAIIFGLLALTWRDVTVLVLGVAFGAWLLVRGVRLLVETVGPRWLGRRREGRASRGRPRIVLAASSLVLALLLAAVGGRLLGTPHPDDFYTPPLDVPEAAGVLLRAEPFTRAVPDGATAWRILYTTTRDEGMPAVASGLVVVPDGAQAAPVVAWDHGTTGVAVGCAPTLLADPLASGAMPDPAAVVDAGWAIVMTDYIGLGADPPHEYLVGQGEARATLDAVRAAHQLPDAGLGDRTVVWGHSQGGGAALWTGGVAPGYAPELDILGVAAMAPAANLPAMIDALAGDTAGTLVGPLVLAGFAERYDDVRVSDYLRPEATLLYEETLARCWSDPAMLVSVVGAVAIDRPIWRTDPNAGPLAQRLEENVPRLPIEAPLLLAQGLADTLVLPDAQRAYVEELCAAGQAVDYRTYEGQDHVGVVGPDSPLPGELLRWTADRFAGLPADDTCP